MENTAGPTILTTATSNVTNSASQISKNPGNWFKNNLVRIVIVVLVIGVLAEVFFGAYTLFSPSSSNKLSILPQKVSEMRSSQLSLVPDKKNYKTGETVTVDVKLFTGGYTTDSTDLVVKYDPAFLQAPSNNFAEVGQIYSEYPAVQVDAKNGMVGISGITLPGKSGFSGVGTFAKLNFKALKDGQTQLSIDYQPDSTADSNVVLAGSTKDVLGSVQNVDINISANPGNNSVAQGQSCDSFVQSCQDSNGKGGTQVCKSGMVKDGSCGYDPELTTTCEICKTQ